MKIVILFVFAVVIGAVYGQIACIDGDATDCAAMVCEIGYSPRCYSDQCWCDTSGPGHCTVLSDCDTLNYWKSHHCGHSHRECNDNGYCHCNSHHHG